MSKAIGICDECMSQFYIDSSKMAALCPNCAFHLYGYENCRHEMINGRCIKCYWNGQVSEYISKLKLL